MAEGLPGYSLGAVERAWIEHVFSTGIESVRQSGSTGLAVAQLLTSMEKQILNPSLTSTFTSRNKI